MDGMVLSKRSGRLCYRISTLAGFIQSGNPKTTALVRTIHPLEP
ncbi:hypothetical protein [Paenibacillus gallinarum]|nr:hypothetical protein [Paenibacillus gallinarum]